MLFGLGSIFFVFLFSQFSFAMSSRTVFRFSEDDLSFSKWNQFDQIAFSEGDAIRDVGKPQLPIVARRILLPAGARFLSLEVVPLDSIVISGTYRIFPAQKPRILSNKGPIPWQSPNPDVYTSNTPFPQFLAQTEGVYSFFSRRFAEVLLYPLRYYPRSGKLILFTKIQVTLHYKLGTSSANDHLISPTLPPDVRKGMQKFFGQESIFPTEGITEQENTSQNSIPYLIITDESFVDAFRPLAEWKTKKGLRTKILTTQYISGKYYGRDLAEKIRACIGFYHQYRGTLWVLLGGDTRFVPLRYAWAMDCEAHYATNENNIPADIYFSDLDGIWDANKNGIFGEVRDRINLYPDVFVGRFSANSEEGIQTMVHKVLTYEKNPPLDYTTRMLFLAMILWDSPYTDSGEGKNYIGDTFVPEQFKPITKLYQSRGNESVQSATDAMNSGYNIVNHDGHAWYNSMGMGEGYFGLWDADHLVNAPNYSILFSIGCWPGAFDKDCMAEHLTRNPNGGMVAFIGNSRYGWGSPGNPKFGYSDRFDQQFFRQIFVEKVSHIGEALALAKASLAPFARRENVYRWCEYEINLFGDPEMPVWTNTPKKLAVELPDKMVPDSSLLTVTVRDSATGETIPNARVCVYQKGHVYNTGFTGTTGQFSFFLKGATADTTLSLTVTAPNFLPYERDLAVRVAGAFVRVVNAQIDDAAGNGDGILNPDETVHLKGFLKNFGTRAAENVQAIFHKVASIDFVSDSVISFEKILPGDSVAFAAFETRVSRTVRDGEVVTFDISVLENGAEKWKSLVPFVAGVPNVQVASYRVDDRNEGNGNFMPEYGEHFLLRLCLENLGHGNAEIKSVILIPDSLWLVPKETQFSGENLSPGAKNWIQTKAYVNPIPFMPPIPRPVAVFPPLGVKVICTDTTFLDTIHVSIGSPGFEYVSGQGCVIPWEMGGQGNLWHLTTYRTHADSVSWYCGDENSHRYNENMNAYLRTIPFLADQKSELSFWAWYDVTVYGVDGFYVEVRTDSSDWQVLDFIGSGGALSPFLMGNGWLRYTYDLSQFPAGTSMQVQFRFVSDDNDQAEGVYIEHVMVKSQMETAVTNQNMSEEKSSVPKQFTLRQNYPNPFNQSTVIEYALPKACLGGRFSVFNILGEEVYSRRIGPQQAGMHRTFWNATGRGHCPLETGLYFYRIQMGDFQAIRKLVLVK